MQEKKEVRLLRRREVNITAYSVSLIISSLCDSFGFCDEKLGEILTRTLNELLDYVDIDDFSSIEITEQKYFEETYGF